MLDLKQSSPDLPDTIKKCINALEKAQNDTEKIAALFLIPKLIKDAECTRVARISLIDAIGFTFLTRMLRSTSAPDGCSPQLYQSVALTILSCFTMDEEIMGNPSILVNIPQLLDIIGDVESTEETQYIVNDAYQCLVAIGTTEVGRAALIDHQGIHKLCEIIEKDEEIHEDAMNLLVNILALEGNNCWNYPASSEDYDNFMMKLVQRFSNLKDEKKFKMCDTIRTVLRSFPLTKTSKDSWMPLVLSELLDILLSKIGKNQRDPTIMLLAAITETSNFDWSQSDEERGKGVGHFLFVATNLATIELTLHFEEHSLDELIEHSDLLISCYFIIESAAAYIASQDALVIDEKYAEKLQIAFKNGFGMILRFLNDMSAILKEEPHHFEDPQKKHFVYATMKVLCAWLAEETMAMREEVIELLPFICTLSSESFSSQKASKLSMLPGRGKDMVEKTNEFPDLLRFFLPGLCHLIVEDKPRKILTEMKMPETLYTYINYHWTIFNSYHTWLLKSIKGKIDASSIAKAEMDNSRDAIATICGIIMNLVVLEGSLVNQNPVFSSFLGFAMKTFNTIDHADHNMVLVANLAVLGMMILGNISKKPKSTDENVSKFIQKVAKFLQEAHSYEVLSGKFEISSSYADHWEDIGDLWFLGMQALSNVLEQVTWARGLVSDLNWGKKIVLALEKIGDSGIDSTSVSALETLLCQLILENDEVKNILGEKEDIVAICHKHHMKKLLTFVS